MIIQNGEKQFDVLTIHAEKAVAISSNVTWASASAVDLACCHFSVGDGREFMHSLCSREVWQMRASLQYKYLKLFDAELVDSELIVSRKIVTQGVFSSQVQH